LTAGVREDMWALGFTADGNWAVGCGVRSVVSWDLASGRRRQVWTFSEPNRDLAGRAPLPDGRCAVYFRRDRAARILNLETREVKELGAHPDELTALAASADGKRVVTVSHDRGRRECVLKVWDTETGTELRQIDRLPAPMDSLVVSRDGRRALGAVRNEKPVVVLWDLEKGRQVRAIDFAALVGEPRARLPYVMTLSPDGARGALSVGVTAVVLVDLEAGRLIHRLEPGPAGVCSVAFSPDGRCVLIGAGVAERALCSLWDVASGRPIFYLDGHNRRVVSLAFSPDGRRALSSSDDATVRLWNFGPAPGSTPP
jgi:WD40 repeat protein